jgi:hypothetical protein
MADFVEVIDAGNGWTQVRDAEGNVFKLEGARNWRNNNPGNLEYGEFAKSLGAVGSDGRFAVFPSYDAGRQAKERLIFSSPSYRDLTLEQAISRYAPPNENNTRSYINQVAAAAGVPASTPMNQIPATVRGNVLNAMERVEGFKPGRTYNEQGIPLPPAEVPNAVASALSVTQPRVSPNPVTMSPDLAQMRNPIMSSSARYAQVTPSGDVPLPRHRPVTAMDIARAPGQTIAAIPTTARPGQSQIERAQPSAREIAMAPGTTIATIPTSGIGRPPATRSVQSVPYNLQPTAREIAAAPGVTIATIPTTTTPTASQIASAARRAALTANQSNVERAVPAPRPVGSSTSNINSQRAEQLGQRAATNIPSRLSPGVAAQAYDVSINGPAGLTRQQFAALPLAGGVPAAPQLANVPLPRARSAMPPAVAAPRPQQSLPIMAQSSAPLRITVNGANSYSAPAMTPVQALQARGLSPSAAYESANASARGAPSVEDRVRGETSSGSGDRLVSMPLASNQLLPLLSGSSFVSRYG